MTYLLLLICFQKPLLLRASCLRPQDGEACRKWLYCRGPKVLSLGQGIGTKSDKRCSWRVLEWRGWVGQRAAVPKEHVGDL